MEVFHVHLIKPTRYDDEGYPVQWWRSLIPSNSLASVAALVNEANARGVPCPNMHVHLIDEINTKVDVDKIIAQSKVPGTRVMVMLVGVQTNQFPRAIDIASPLRAAGIPVCMGGFHVAGVIAMLGEDAPELQLCRDLDISMFAGEAEESRIDEVLRDGYRDALKPVYNHLKNMPALNAQPVPILPSEIVAKTANWASFDLGRGCPFECSFCTIINVQGRKSRFRDADDLERIVRENRAIGINKFFVTDDNLARNRNWESYADRLIELQEKEGIFVRLIIQVDTMTHRIPGFIEKMYKAGAHVIFIGMENINPDNLEGAKKRQNRIEEYREMLMAWKIHGCILVCGYILGFPHDTKASILRDVDLIKRELPIDILYLNFLTPLPGCEDHKKMQAAGAWMDPDFNKYNLGHRVSHHPKMSDKEWEEAYLEAHKRFYTFEHMSRVFNRMMQMRTNQPFTTLSHMVVYREGLLIENVAYSEFGIGRVTHRRQRRSGMPLENPLIFYPRIAVRNIYKIARYVHSIVRLRISLARARMRWRKGVAYTDEAIKPVEKGTVDALVAGTADRSTAYARKRQENRIQAQLEKTG